MLGNRFQQLGCILLQKCPQVLTQQSQRTTVVVRRKWQPGLGKGDEYARLKGRHFVYEFVENKVHQKHPPVKVILAENVEGYGAEGDIIDVKATIARKWLLPSGLAVYPSPENLEKHREIQEQRDERGPKHTAYAIKTIRQLRGMQLYLPMNRNVDWTLNKVHVRVAFRKFGVEVPDECITMPEEEITKEDIGKDFTIGVTVNGIEKVDVAAKVVYYELDENGNLPKFPKIWKPQKEMAELED